VHVLVHGVPDCQTPFASQVCGVRPLHALAPGVQTPVHTPFSHTYWHVAPLLVQSPVELHSCGCWPLHWTEPGVHPALDASKPPESLPLLDPESDPLPDPESIPLLDPDVPSTPLSSDDASRALSQSTPSKLPQPARESAPSVSKGAAGAGAGWRRDLRMLDSWYAYTLAPSRIRRRLLRLRSR
jgi:hypothetical protein